MKILAIKYMQGFSIEEVENKINEILEKNKYDSPTQWRVEGSIVSIITSQTDGFNIITFVQTLILIVE